MDFNSCRTSAVKVSSCVNVTFLLSFGGLCSCCLWLLKLVSNFLDLRYLPDIKHYLKKFHLKVHMTRKIVISKIRSFKRLFKVE